MDPRVQPLAAILRLNTRLLLNCLEGLSDEMARVRHATGVNSATFIAAHVTDSRYFLLQTLGSALENPLSRFLDKAKTIDEVRTWPSLDTVRGAWKDVSAALDTLEPEGARNSTKGLGLYKFVESENEKALNKAKKDLDNFKSISGSSYQEDQTGEPTMADELVVPEMKKVPQDLSGYVTFLHPWMNEVVSQFVLMLMFWIMAFCTLIALKIKDLR